MTIADMSIITAEVHVDETDIVSVRMGQPAEVSIDALPNQTFKGKVIEIGDTGAGSIYRLSGFAKHHLQPGSERLQSSGRVGYRREPGASWPVVHGKNHHQRPEITSSLSRFRH